MLRLVLLLSLAWMSVPASAALHWSFGEAQARPGEIGFIELRLRSDGDAAAAGLGVLIAVDSRHLVVPATGALFDAAAGAVCLRRNQFVVDLVLASLPAPGVEIVACRIPLRPRAGATRFDAPVRAFAPCGGTGSCDLVALGHFHIDGPAHWRDRALTVVPRASAPPREELIAFDYAGSPLPAPLRMFEAPRPAEVAGAFAAFPEDNAYAKTAVAPNAAVAALLRSVRAIYPDEAARARAEAGAARDPMVEGVLPAPYFGLRTWPARPRAGEAFALWFTDYVCTHINPLHFEDRAVEVTGGTVTVLVASNQLVDFATCPGGESHRLLNLPGLPAGHYALRLVAVSAAGETTESHETALEVVAAQGGADAAAIRAVPATLLVSAACLAGLLAALGLHHSRRNAS